MIPTHYSRRAFYCEFCTEKETEKEVEDLVASEEDDTEPMEGGDEDALYDDNLPDVLARPPKRAATPPPEPSKLTLESELNASDASHCLEVDTCPTVVYHTDIQKVARSQARVVPLHSGVLTEEDMASMLVKLIKEGTELELKYPYPKILYDLTEASREPIWDDIYGVSACQGRSAMINMELEMRDKYEHAGAIWAVQRIKLKEKMDVIESFHLEKGANGSRAVIVCLKGPDSPYKKKKITERALKPVTHGSASKTLS